MQSNDPLPKVNDPDAQSDGHSFISTVDQAMKRAVCEAIAAHHRAGHPVAIWRDGQVVLWYPDGTYRLVEREDTAGTAGVD